MIKVMKRKRAQIPILKNYLSIAKASVEAKTFRTLYVIKNDHAVDILRNGDLSCAFFVSSILKLFDLIGEIHTTVSATMNDLEARGWRRIKKPRKGAVIVWAPKKFKNGEVHRHIGIYIGGGKAVSNSSKKRSPQIHAWDFRSVEKILINKNLS